MNYCHNIARAQHLNTDKSNTIIIDGGSSIGIVADKRSVPIIHKAPPPLKVKTSNGEYPRPVWFYPKGSIDILSLNNM